MTGLLDPPDIERLTKYVQRRLQADWLATHGIPFKRDGSRIIVAWSHVNMWIEGKPLVGRGGMNLGAIK